MAATSTYPKTKIYAHYIVVIAVNPMKREEE